MRVLFAIGISAAEGPNAQLAVKHEARSAIYRVHDEKYFDLEDFHELNKAERKSFIKEYLSIPGNNLATLLQTFGLDDKENWGVGNVNFKELIDTISDLAATEERDSRGNAIENPVTKSLYDLFTAELNDIIDGDKRRQIAQLFIRNCQPNSLNKIIKNALTSNNIEFLKNLLQNDCDNKVRRCLEDINKSWLTSKNTRDVIQNVLNEVDNSLGSGLQTLRKLGIERYDRAVDGSGTISRADLLLLTGNEREDLCVQLIKKLPDSDASRILQELIAQGLLNGLDSGSWDNIGAAGIRKINSDPNSTGVLADCFEKGLNAGIHAGIYPSDDVDVENKDTPASSISVMLYDSFFQNDAVFGVSNPKIVARDNLKELQESNLFSGINNIGGGAYEKTIKIAKGIVSKHEIKTAAVRAARTARQREGNVAVSAEEAKKNREAFQTAARSQVDSARGVVDKTPPESGRTVTYSFPAGAIPRVTGPNNLKQSNGITTIALGGGDSNISIENGNITIRGLGLGNPDEVRLQDGQVYGLDGVQRRDGSFSGAPLGTNDTVSIHDGRLHIKIDDHTYVINEDNSITHVSQKPNDRYTLSQDGSYITTADGFTINSEGKISVSFDLLAGIDAEQFQQMAIAYLSATRDGAAIGSPTSEDIGKLMAFMKELSGIFINWDTKSLEERRTALISAFCELGLPPQGNDSNQQNWLDIMFPPLTDDGKLPDPLPQPKHFLYNFLNGKSEDMFKAIDELAVGDGTQELFRNGKSLLMCHNLNVYTGDKREPAVEVASSITSGKFGDSAAFKNFVYNHTGNDGALLLAAALYGLGKTPPPTALPAVSLIMDGDNITGIKYGNDFIMSVVKDIDENLLAELRLLAKINDENFLEENRESLEKLGYIKEGQTKIFEDSLAEEIRERSLSRVRDYIDTHSVRYIFNSATTT